MQELDWRHEVLECFKGRARLCLTQASISGSTTLHEIPYSICTSSNFHDVLQLQTSGVSPAASWELAVAKQRQQAGSWAALGALLSSASSCCSSAISFCFWSDSLSSLPHNTTDRKSQSHRAKDRALNPEPGSSQSKERPPRP